MESSRVSTSKAHAKKHDAAAKFPLDFLFAVLDRPRVLIAEGDAAVSQTLQHWLRNWEYDTILAKDGLQAWEILQQRRPPELVIVDWAISGVDSIELCRRLRDISRKYYPYIIMITGQAHKQDVVHALESGADDYLVLPFEEAELRARLKVASRIVTLQDRLISSREEHRVQAMKDGLTGLWNRTAFLDIFKRELDRAERANTSTGLLLLDLDHFKKINDTYGHLTGDVLLKETAHRLKQNVRSYDFVGRYGGEEFFIALPGCDEMQICKRAEAIRRAIADEPVRVGKTEIEITISIGATAASTGAKSTLDVLAASDRALYKAKGSGRNRVVYCDRSGLEMPESMETPRTRCAHCSVGRLDECVVSALEGNLMNECTGHRRSGQLPTSGF